LPVFLARRPSVPRKIFLVALFLVALFLVALFLVTFESTRRA
jgi:hypothetical protein